MNIIERTEGRPDLEDVVRETAAFMLLLEDHIERRDRRSNDEGFTDSTLCGLYLLRQRIEDRLFQAFCGHSNRRTAANARPAQPPVINGAAQRVENYLSKNPHRLR